MMRKKTPIDALMPRVRQGILSAALLQPDRWWYLTDLAKHLGIRPSSLQRELASLTSAGILRSRREGNRVYFQAEPACPFLADLQRLLAKTVGLADILRKALHPFEARIASAFIYGSIARGEELGTSDVDLLVIGEVELSMLASAIRRVEDQIGRPVHVSTYAQSEFAEQARAGNHFLRDVLAGEKIFLNGGAVELEAALGFAADSPAPRKPRGTR